MVSSEAFRARARVRRRRSWRRWTLTFLALTVAAGLVWLVGLSSALAVRHVEVEGVKGAAAGEITRLAKVPLGEPLIRVDQAAIRDRVRTRPELAEVSVGRSWPDTITIAVVPRVPRVVLREGSTLRLADATGVVYATVDNSPKGLPVVSLAGGPSSDGTGVTTVLGILEAVPPDLSRAVGALEMSRSGLVRFSLGKVRIVWGDGEQAERKVELIRVLLRTKPAAIDVSAPGTPVTS